MQGPVVRTSRETVWRKECLGKDVRAPCCNPLALSYMPLSAPAPALAPNPKPYTLNPEPYTRNPKPESLSARVLPKPGCTVFLRHCRPEASPCPTLPASFNRAVFWVLKTLNPKPFFSGLRFRAEGFRV